MESSTMKKQACLFESQKCTRIHDNAIIVAKYHYSGKFIATASADKKAKITSTKSGEVVQTLTEHTLGLNDCVWIGASHLATGSDDKLIKLWDVEKGVKISSISCHKSFVFALASHPYSDLLLSGSCDGSIRITDIRTGNCVRAIEAHADVVSCLDINPSNHGREFASCSYDGSVRTWLYAYPSSCTSTLYNKDESPMASVRYSPNGAYCLLGAMKEPLVSLYSLTTSSDKNISRLDKTREDMKGVGLLDQCIRTYGYPRVASNSEVDDFHSENTPEGSTNATGSKSLGHAVASMICPSGLSGAGKSPSVLSGTESDHVMLWDLDSTVPFKLERESSFPPSSSSSVAEGIGMHEDTSAVNKGDGNRDRNSDSVKPTSSGEEMDCEEVSNAGEVQADHTDCGKSSTSRSPRESVITYAVDCNPDVSRREFCSGRSDGTLVLHSIRDDD